MSFRGHGRRQVEHADISDIIAGRHELEALQVRFSGFGWFGVP